MPLCLAFSTVSYAADAPALAATTGAEQAGAESVAPAPATKKYFLKDAPKDSLSRAKILIETHQEDEAVALLKGVMATSSQPQSLAQAYLLMAEALSGKQEYAEAVNYLERLLSEFPDSDLTVRARLLLGATHTRLGDADTALSILSEARGQAADVETKRTALYLIGDAYAGKKDSLRAVQAWVEELALSPEEQRSEPRERIRTLVQEQADKKTLLQLRDAYPTTFPGDLVLIRLIELHTNRGEEHLAEKNIRLFLTHFSTHEYAAAAAEQLKGFKAKVKSSQYVLAAVLPASGHLSAFGAEALNGIRLALDKGKEALGLPSVGLVVKDSAAPDKSALRAELADLVAEYRPMAVIGPLLSRDLPAAAAIADETATPFVTPAATVSDVHRFSSYLFNTALTYQQQARRLADYAVTRMGYRRFCILHPETAPGHDLTRYFIQEVKQRGGEIIAVEAYAENDTDFGPQIKRLKTEDLKRHGKATTSKTAKGAVKITYKPGFDAIFLPGSAAQAALTTPQLLFYDVKVPFLGSNGWDSPELIRLAERTVDGGVFVDGLFADSQDPTVKDFVERYRRRYQTTPTLFAAQAYEATRVVLDAIRKGAASGKAVRDYLAKQPDLPTLNGPASFGPSGTLDRRPFLIQIKHGKFVPLE
ncbi:MAG: penicillin-binding protein activator [Nitrospirae bacterium]|nr:penicillin-binding protein activator [Nitrospirota bacterium]